MKSKNIIKKMLSSKHAHLVQYTQSNLEKEVILSLTISRKSLINSIIERLNRFPLKVFKETRSPLVKLILMNVLILIKNNGIKKIKGLYFTGEVINVAGWPGNTIYTGHGLLVL